MKTYEEMIRFTADEVTEGAKRMRYTRWPAYILLGFAYSKTEEEVCNDLNAEIAHREQAERMKRKEESRAANIARQKANLARKGVF